MMKIGIGWSLFDMGSLFEYIAVYMISNINNYLLVCGDVVVVDDLWYDVMYFNGMCNIDRLIHENTGCKYFVYVNDPEYEYEWFEGLGYYG